MIKRPTLALAVLLALLTGAPAFAQKYATFGSTATSGTPSSGLTGDFKRASKFTLTEQGIVTYIGAYMDGLGGGTGTQYIRFAIYQDTGGVPGAKIVETDPGSPVFAGDTANWFTGTLAATVVLDPGAYWVAIQSDSNAPGVARDYSSGSAQNWYGNADTFADGASDPFGTGTTGSGTLMIQVGYNPTSGLSHFGRTDVASLASGGLSADYKRASKFTLTEKATLVGLSAYLDSSGGGTGSQSFSLVVYRDNGGVPGSAVAISGQGALSPGTVKGWVFLAAAPTALDPGSYWIAIHTSGPSGVLRDYGDGAANWYGNADVYNDGPSNPFGSGTSGTSTLSVYAFYQPGYAFGQYGSSTPGSLPSSGLTANYVRASEFAQSTGGGVNAFYAYLDGNGGMSGTQALRIATYIDDRGNPAGRIGQSDTVTISAGMAPQWVYFPVSFPFWLGGLSYMGIQSGDTGGVVRDYSSSGGTWIGSPAPFADGAPLNWPSSPTAGNTTLSIYATYVVSPPWWNGQ